DRARDGAARGVDPRAGRGRGGHEGGDALMQQIPADQVPITGAPFLIASVIKILVIFTMIMVLVALWTYVERRVCAFMQNRLGPNRVGPQGILQPAADGLKNFLKEETLPPFANRGLFILAPMLSFTPALLTFSV